MRPIWGQWGLERAGYTVDPSPQLASASEGTRDGADYLRSSAAEATIAGQSAHAVFYVAQDHIDGCAESTPHTACGAS